MANKKFPRDFFQHQGFLYCAFALNKICDGPVSNARSIFDMDDEALKEPVFKSGLADFVLWKDHRSHGSWIITRSSRAQFPKRITAIA